MELTAERPAQVAAAALGEVTFEADGRAWRLRFGVNALCRLEANVEDPAEIERLVGDRDGEAPQLSTVRAAVWAGLFDHHPEITFDDAGALIDHVGLQAMGSKIGQAIVVGLPKRRPGANPPKPARRKGRA